MNRVHRTANLLLILILADQSISDGERFPRLKLADHVTDADHDAGEIDWQVSGAGYVVPMHYQFTVPPPDYDLMASYFPEAIVFRESMETWTLPD